MGDRTTCTLRLRGEIKRADWLRLCEVIKDELAPDEWSRDETEMTMYGVNFGKMTLKAAEALAEAGLDWAWAWKGGYGYGAGMKVHDAESGEERSFALSHDGDLVAVMDGDEDEFRAECEQVIVWNQWLTDDWTLTITD